MALTNKRGNGWIEVEGLGRVSDSDYERMLRQGQIKIVNNKKQNQTIANMLTGEMMTTGIPQKREIPQEAYEEAKLPRSPLQELAERATFGSSPSNKTEETKSENIFDFLFPSSPEDYIRRINGGQIDEKLLPKVSTTSEPRDKWGDLSKRSDYEEKSKYKSSYRGGEVLDPIRLQYLDNGYDDIEHDIINKDKGAKFTWLNDNGWNNQETNRINTLELLDENQLKNYNYIYNTEGKESAKEYLDYIKKDLNKTYRANTEKYWEEEGKKNNPLVNAAARTILNNNSLVESIPIATNRILKTGKLDPNDVNIFGSGIAAEALERGNSQRKKESGVVGEALYNAAETAEGIGEYVFMPFARILSVGSAFNNTVRRNLEKGLDEDEAIGLGAIAGGVQFALSKAMQKYTKLTPTDIIKDGKLVAVLKNMGKVFGIGEAADIVNIVSDTLIARDKSDLERIKNGYVEQGMSEEEAWGRTIADAVLTTSAHNASKAAIAGLFATIRALGSKVSQVEDLPSTRVYREKAKPLGLEEGIISDVNFDPEGNMTVNQGVRETYSPYAQDAELNPDTGRYETGYQSYEEPTLDFEEEIPKEEFAYTPDENTPQNDVSAETTALTPYNNQDALSARISEETPSLDKDVANYITALYDPATNADEDSYLVEANDAYLAGYEGEDKNSLPTENLSTIQADALYELGKQKREEDNELRIRESGERNDGESTSRQVQPVEESTGRNQERKAEIRSGGDSKANATVFSQSELDIHAPDIVGKYKVVQSSTSKDYNLAVEKAKKAGFKLVGVDGYMQFEDPNTKEISEKGAFVDYDNKTIYASVNSDEYTTSQYVDHELFHNEIDSGRVNLKETLNTVREKMGDVQFDRAINDYANMYEGLYDDLQGDERTEKIFTEMACDSHADMNVYAGKYTTMAQEYAKTQQTIRENTVYNEDNQANAPPTGFSTKATKGEDLAKQNKQLEKEIARISKNAEKWRNETKISNPIRPKEADVNKFSKEFKQRFSSTLPLDTLKKRVDALFKTMLNVDKLSEDARWASIKAMGIDLASDLVNSSEELKVVYPEYEDIQRELMRGVTISDEDKANIPDFNDFRKRNIRNVKIVKEGIAVDSLYQELNQQYPYLFPETLTNPADQLMRMAEVAEEIRPDLVNPYEEYGLDMASIIESVANEIIEETYGQIAPYETFADKKATEIKELKTQFKEKAKALRDKRDEDIKSLKKHNAERRRQESNRRKASKLREKITRHAKALSDKLLKPTDKKHITEGREVRGGRDVEPLRRVVAEVLSLINQESSFGYTEEGKRTKDKDRIVFAAKKTEAWNRLLKEYQKIVNDGTYQVDESLEDVRGYISQIAQYAKTPISELGVEQLQNIYDCLRSLENTIEHAEKMLSADKSPAQLAYALKDETKNNKQRVIRGVPLYDNFVMGMVSPQAFFERLGKTLYNFAFKGLRQAQNNFIELTKEFQKWASENIDGKTKYEWEHDEHTVKLGGKEVKMSSAQLMDLYILSNREQGADHIYQGGIELRNKPTGIEIAKDVAKNIKEAFTHTESGREESVIRRITPEEVTNACSKLTREQLELAQKMSKYVNEDLSAIGNKASMDVFGYEKFLEGAYWHIKTVASDRIKNNSVTTGALPVSVGSAGFTKPTVENAQSAIYVGSVFTDFMETVVNMNNYASYLAIQEDMKRLLNYKFYDEKGKPAGNVEQILNETFGQGQGVKYWTKLMSDIASGVKAYDLLQGNMLGKFKSTAVGANLRVIVQQPTAILRALDMLDAKYLAMGMANPLKGSKEAIKYSPLAQWKSWGYFDINTGRSLEDLIFGTPNAFRKAQEYMMEGAAKADDFAWGVLWNAVKAEIKDTTNLKEGSQEFYDAVKERFEDIVDRTQVVDGVLQRSAFLRDGGTYTKMLTAFMGEPIKQYNQFMNTVYKMRKGEANLSDLIKTGSAMIAAGTLNALVKSLVDAMRHSKRDKDFWEQYVDDLLGRDDKGLDFFKFMSGNFGEQFDPLTYLPYIRDLESAFKGYTVARTDLSVFTDIIKEAQQFMKATNGKSKYTLPYATERFILQLAKLTGLPLSNAERDIKAFIDTIINNFAPTAVAYEYNKYFYNASQSDNKKAFVKMLQESQEKGDTKAYEYILKDLEAQGVTEKSIKTQLDNIQKDEIKKETGAEKVTVKDIENRVSAEIFGANGTSTRVDITDNPTYKEVSSSKIWSQASPAMQQSINEDIANLQSGSNSKLQAQVSKAKSYGKSESDWLLFTLARKVVDANEGNNNQHYDKTEETKAGQMTGFTYEQIKQIKSAK